MLSLIMHVNKRLRRFKIEIRFRKRTLDIVFKKINLFSVIIYFIYFLHFSNIQQTNIVNL
jgi:hypothetical protein